MDRHRIGAKPCPEGRDQDRGWSVSAGDVSPGQIRPMPSDCYACQQAGPEAPLRERFVRADGWRVAHDFNSSLESWLILAPLRHVRALDVLTPAEAARQSGVVGHTVSVRVTLGCRRRIKHK